MTSLPCDRWRESWPFDSRCSGNGRAKSFSSTDQHGPHEPNESPNDRTGGGLAQFIPIRSFSTLYHMCWVFFLFCKDSHICSLLQDIVSAGRSVNAWSLAAHRYKPRSSWQRVCSAAELSNDPVKAATGLGLRVAVRFCSRALAS